MKDKVGQIGQVLAQVRKARGLTQGQLAKKCKLTLNYVSMLECGRRFPSADALGAIGKVLDVPSELLVFLSADPAEMEKKGPGLARLVTSTQEAILATMKLDAATAGAKTAKVFPIKGTPKDAAKGILRAMNNEKK